MSSIQNLTELLKKYTVEIPIVQRDYAQGRKDDHASLVRNNLLTDIKSAIVGKTTSLDLSFVYGKDIDKKFIPLDGQQRLTTLFLLHVYAFRDNSEMDKLLHKFTYETRKSSRDFFSYLIDNREEVFAHGGLPSEEITDAEWFVSEWENDPTVQSSLVVLDEIVDKFSDVDDLTDKLTKDDDKPLIFQFLNMDDLGMEDSLYIKLNARGKPLTPFENFKARLFAQLKDVDAELSQKFEMLFDGKWTDFFWKEFHKDFDDGFLRFFQVLFDNNNIIDRTNNWANRFDFSNLHIDIFKNIYNTLNSVESTKYPIIRELIVRGIAPTSNYYDRLLFHAVTEYINVTAGEIGESFEKWLRVLNNLIINSQIDDTRTNSAAIKGINELASNYADILDYLASNGKVSGFSSEQVKEERTKAKIIQYDDEFAEVIYDAEKNSYFTGTIRPALYHAVDGEGYNIDVFSSYWKKIEKLFESDKPKYGNLIRQALLAYSDYTLDVGAYKTLCVNDAKEGGSTPSIKRLFADYPDRVKLLLDDLDVAEDFELQLNDIVSKSSVTEDDWRYCFINYPSLFDEMSISHLRLRFIEKRKLIVSKLSTNGYNSDLYLATLKAKLETLDIDSDQYQDAQGTYADLWLEVGDYVVRYDADKYIVTKDDEVVFEVKSEKMIDETAAFLNAEIR